VPEWRRILLAGMGCFLLTWLSRWLALPAGGSPLWFPDALLIYLALERRGSAWGIELAAGAIGILIGVLLAAGGVFAPAGLLMAVLLTAASILHVVPARFLLLQFAPDAARVEGTGALAHVLLWSALVSPVLGAIIMSGAAFASDAPSPLEAFVSWWIASGAGTAILLPFILSLAYSPRTDLGLVVSRWREALLVLALMVVVAVVARQPAQELPLLLGLPLVLWSALRLDFRITSFLCVVVALSATASVVLATYEEASGAVSAAEEQQAFLLAIIVPAMFASLFRPERREGDKVRQTTSQAIRAVLDALPLAIVISAPDGKVTLWSRGAERIFGWRRNEVEGTEPPFAGPDDTAEEASLRQRVLAGNEIQNQPVRRRDKDGTLRDLVISAAPQRAPDGTITGTIFVMEDVTDRRRLEASREEQRARLAAILDAVADPIITADENGMITSFSRAAEAVFGYSAAEAIGSNLRILMPEPDRSRHDAYLRRYRETGVKHIIGSPRQFTAQRKDGRTVPVELSISEAWLNGKRIFAGLVRDLSSKPSAAAADGARPPADGGAAKVLSKITHDLRQPIHALTLMTSALERRVQDPDSRAIVEDLCKVVRSIQAAFENIVEWTRIESGPISVVPVDIRAGDILKPLAEEFSAEASRRRIVFHCVPANAMIACDPALLQRILRQFLDNAMKFTPSGKVLLGARRHSQMLRLVVADTGVGIPADQSDLIFRPYNRLDPGREAGGLGLGLAIARRLAEVAGLEIGVHSEPGKGSQFWINVPRSGGRILPTEADALTE
jgi:PAS domain S-box-containing protein